MQRGKEERFFRPWRRAFYGSVPTLGARPNSGPSTRAPGSSAYQTSLRDLLASTRARPIPQCIATSKEAPPDNLLPDMSPPRIEGSSPRRHPQFVSAAKFRETATATGRTTESRLTEREETAARLPHRARVFSSAGPAKTGLSYLTECCRFLSFFSSREVREVF